MKKLLRKKVTLAMLSVLMLLTTLLSACSSSNGGSSAPVEEEEQGNKLTSMEVFSELGSWAAQSIKTYGDNLVFQEMEKMTGVKVKWVHPPSGQTTEQFNLMVASNDLPDMIVYNWFSAPGGMKKFVDDGVILDLTPYLEEHAPNFMKLMNEHPEARKQSMDDESRYYCMPMLRLDDPLRVVNGPQVRIDWLEKLNMERPTTIDDWYDMLKAFKADNPSGWPLTGQKFVGINGIGNLVGAWGISYDMYVDNGTIKYGPLDPKFKEALTFIHQLFSEGLIDPDYMINNREKQDAKVTSGASGVMFGVQPSNFMRTMVESGREPNFVMDGVSWPTGADGKAYSLINSYTYQAETPCAAITTKAEHPGEIVAWLDYAYGEEGNMLFNLGIEGETYTIVDGVGQYTEIITQNEDGLGVSAAMGKYTMALNGWAMAQDVQYHRQLMLPYGYPAADYWRTADMSLLMPRLTFTTEETQQVARLKTDIDTYSQEMFDKFTTGQASLDEYDAFVQRLIDMGIEPLIAIYQAAYDRYQQRGE